MQRSSLKPTVPRRTLCTNRTLVKVQTNLWRTDTSAWGSDGSGCTATWFVAWRFSVNICDGQSRVFAWRRREGRTARNFLSQLTSGPSIWTQANVNESRSASCGSAPSRTSMSDVARRGRAAAGNARGSPHQRLLQLALPPAATSASKPARFAMRSICWAFKYPSPPHSTRAPRRDLLLHVWLIEVKRVDVTRRGGTVPPRLSTHRLLLGKDVPEEPAVSAFGFNDVKLSTTVMPGNISAPKTTSHHCKGSEELGEALEEAAHEFEHIVHDVRVLCLA